MGVCEGECMGLPQLYEVLEGWKFVCGQVYNLKGIKGKLMFLFYCSSFEGMMQADPAVMGRGNV